MRIRTHLSTKKSKRMCLIGTRRELGQSPKRCHSALWKCRSTLQKCQMVLLDTNALSCSHTFWTPFLVFFESGLALRLIFNLYSKIFTSFLDNLGLFNNNYLVDKYSKINLDKIQIIHNFIVIQLSPLFLCKQSYFKH